MKTKITFIGLLLLIANMAMAGKISEAQALAIAESFANGNSAMGKSTVQGANRMTLAHASAGYYAFNRGSSGGFVLVAADDQAAASVLGYADSGSFSTDDMPDNMRWWLSEYDRQIEYAAANATQGSKTRVATPVYEDIAPLLTCYWGQNDPFSGMCPKVGGTECPTGCVATAMAQIMYYHKWPERGTGSHSYTWNRQQLSVDFSQSVYDWDSMTDMYSSNSTEEENNAVAKLMYDIGVAVEMAYSASGSGASSYMPPVALYNYFGYDEGMNNYVRDAYGYNEWVEMLYNELAEGRPVFYAGTTSSNEGHAFVCDGYSDGYFHINWGWRSMSDGYFLVTALDPVMQGVGGSTTGFNYNQSVTTGIKKAEEGSTFNPIVYCEDFTVGTSTTYRRSSRATFGSVFYYLGIKDFIANYGVMIVNSTGTDTVYVPATTPTSFEAPEASGYIYYRDFTVQLRNFPEADGNYLVFPAFCDEDGVWRKIRSCGTDHVVATVSGSSISFAYPEEGESALSASGITLTSSVFAGRPFTATATLSNGGAEYYGTVRMVVLDSLSNQLTTSADVVVDIPEGGTTEVKFEPTAPETAGTYTLAIVDEDGNIINSTSAVTVEAAVSANATVKVNSFVVENADNVVATDLRATVDITCSRGYYKGILYGYIFEPNGRYSIGYIITPSEVIMGEGDTKTIELAGVFAGAEVGKTYVMMLTDASNNYITYISPSFTVSAITGIDGVKTDTEAADITIYNTTGAIVAKQKGSDANLSGMPTGVYLVKKGNVVKRVMK